MLVAAVIALTLGELFEAAGEWGLSATLASHGEHGLFQSACAFGESTQSAVGPLLVASMVTAFPTIGWLFLISMIGGGRFLAGFLSPARSPKRALAAAGAE